MKILTILLVLLQINTFGYGNYSSHYSNNYNGYSSVSVEQTYRGIGYTTNYGNSFQYELSNTPKQLGYTTDERIYGILNNDTQRKVSDSKEDEWTGYVTEMSVTIYYKVEKILGVYYFFITYSDGSSETYYGWFDHKGAVAHAQEVAREKAREQAMAVPIGPPDFYLITALLFSYFIYNYMKKRRQQFLLYTGI